MMKILKSFILSFCLLAITSIVSADPGLGSPYIRYWVICGPFTNSTLDKECFRDEAKFSPVAGQIVKGKRCMRYLSWNDSIIFSLDEVFGVYEEAVAYAYTEVYSPTSRKIKLYVGSDDGVKIWLNGENIFTNDVLRGFIYDEDKIEVQLKSGWNRLLIKVYNELGGWAFSARFVRRGGNGIRDLQYNPEMLYQLQIKEIEASSVQPPPEEGEENFNTDNAIDGERWTRWSSEWTDPQWLTVDLGKIKPIKKILLIWESYAKDYAIEFSNDKINWERIYSTTLGEGGQDVIGLPQAKNTRYVRLLFTKRGTRLGYSLWEFQLFSPQE
jgi:hypothetical protein